MHAVYRKDSEGWFSLCWMTIEGRNVACLFQNHTEGESYVRQMQENDVSANEYHVRHLGENRDGIVRLVLRTVTSPAP
jgi:hypothetical protein